MAPLRRWLRRLGLALLALALVAAGGLAWAILGSLPQRNGEVAIPGLEQPVTISRDVHAIPHIRAGSVADAYRAMGFVHGQDRLWQMEFNRRVGQGRLAEILGEPALPADRFLRTLGLARHAEAAAASLPGETLALLEAYAAGVNAAIAAFGWQLPPEFLILRHRPEPWRPADSLLFLKLMAMELSGNWREELLRARLARELTPEQLADLWPETPEAPVTLPGWREALAEVPLEGLAALFPAPLPEGIGSNIWVVGGSRTRTGLPLLANDPHLRLQAPGPWYLAKLEAPGLAVVGATLPALPFIVLGRNRDLAWGFTNTHSDTQDLFVERVEPTDPDRYLTPDGSAPFERRVETIAVRGAEPVRLEVRSTRHGPVISDLVADSEAVAGPGHVLALAWTQLRDRDSTAVAGFAAAQATDVESFMAAMLLFEGAQQNMAVADRHGAIGMISPGLVPIRRSGDGSLPALGWTGTHDWLGMIPPGELPRRVDPADGLIVNANNRLVDGGYPYLLTASWEPALRARRIIELLEGAPDLDLAAMAAVQLDIRSMLAADFLGHLLTLKAADPVEREILAAMRDWDGRMDADRPEPLIFTAWYRELGRALYADELGPLFGAYRGTRADFTRHVLSRAEGWCDDSGTVSAESCADRAAAAFRASLARLREAHGDDWRAWRWGAAHPAAMPHQPFDEVPGLRPLFSLAFPIGGDGSTVAVAHPLAAAEPPLFPAVHAATFRALYDLADLDRSRFAAATGQSGHPFSRHYRDLAWLWRQGRYLRMSLESGTLAGDAHDRLVAVPAEIGG